MPVDRFVARSEPPPHGVAGGGRQPPAGAVASLLLRALDPPHGLVRFDTYAAEPAARRAGQPYRLLTEERGRWVGPVSHAVYAEWQLADPALGPAFEQSRRELFGIRSEHLPTFAADWLLVHVDIPRRYLVLGLYGDEEGATRLCRLHPAIQEYAQAHPPSGFTATDLTGLKCFGVEASNGAP